MRKTILYIAMSLDGYIADRDGGVAWLAGDGSSPDHPGSYPRFYESIDTVILGYATYRQIVTELFPDGWIYQGTTSYVLTHRRERPAGDVIFTDEEIAGLITRLKAAEGRDIWICGGADIVNQLIDRRLIDRYHLTIIPTILGSGLRLFGTRDEEQRLRLVSTETYNGMTDLVFEPREPL